MLDRHEKTKKFIRWVPILINNIGNNGRKLTWAATLKSPKALIHSAVHNKQDAKWCHNMPDSLQSKPLQGELAKLQEAEKNALVILFSSNPLSGHG